MQDTHTSFTSNPGAYPNIIYKKKLVPLPLFRQNRSPKHILCGSPERSPFGFKTSTSGFNSPTRSGPPPRMNLPGIHSPTAAPRSPTFLKEMRTINNYGRLCDQPFIEFSTAHFQQVFGDGTGKKKLTIQPSNKWNHDRNNRKKVTKLGTLGESNLRSPIRVQNSIELGKFHKIKNEDKDNQSIIKKAYKIGEYEAVIGFYSLEVVFVPVKDENQGKIAIRLGRDDLRKVYKYSHVNIVNTVASSLAYNRGRWVQHQLKKDKSLKCDIYSGEETYPEKKDGLSSVIEGQDYEATIYYPYLDITINALDYNERVMLRPSYLSNLFAEKFDNLQDYIQKFNIPPQVYKDKDELHRDELKNLPSIIKKVLKDAEFGGLLLFKSIEIHLKNTSNIEPETIMMGEAQLTPVNQKILKKRKKDVNDVLLRVDISDLDKLTRATAEEITQLIESSIFIEEATGFVLKLDEHKTTILNDRKEIEIDHLPEYSEKFTHRFNRFLYEGFIKFPTLELYVPETNHKDVLHLTPSQLQLLINNEFKNMQQDFLRLFKKPKTLHDQLEENEAGAKKEDQSEQVNNKGDSPSEGKTFTFKQYSINIGTH